MMPWEEEGGAQGDMIFTAPQEKDSLIQPGPRGRNIRPKSEGCEDASRVPGTGKVTWASEGGAGLPSLTGLQAGAR